MRAAALVQLEQSEDFFYIYIVERQCQLQFVPSVLRLLDVYLFIIFSLYSINQFVVNKTINKIKDNISRQPIRF